jgi:hypothetical protein
VNLIPVQPPTELVSAFEREIGVTGVKSSVVQVGTREFLKFTVGREAPLYSYALHEIQRSLSDEDPYRGAVGLTIEKTAAFPESLEAKALLTLLTRSTREVSQDTSSHGFSVPYVPFHKREDHSLAQAATHIVRGRRGVGKSTLIKRAAALLGETKALVATLDMQGYSELGEEDLIRETFFDVCRALSKSAIGKGYDAQAVSDLVALATQIQKGELAIEKAPLHVKRAVSNLTSSGGSNAFVFLDDFHLINQDNQPSLLHALHGALKGANGWLKVAGLSSLLNVYSPVTKKGLQVPGDAQYISLDLTLENPEAAEAHLRAILEKFLEAVGYSFTSVVIPENAFRRLAWANAGVPRDFLQMFARSLEHSQRNRRSTITLSDINVAIGEFGQQKLNDLQLDARDGEGELRRMLQLIGQFCLDDKKVNAFLVRSDDSKERSLVQVLSDLRMVHLIHQSITPDKAGERFEAFIIDYSQFTGFRRRPNVKEMLPQEPQFKASELRALPKISAGFYVEEPT